MTRVLVRFDALLIFALAGCAVFEPPLERRDAGAQSVDSGGRDTSVARDSGSDASPDAGFDAATDAPPSCVVESIMAVDMCTGDVVINEVDGSGDDFIEIYNRGTVAVNVSNWVISDDNAGAPDVADGVVVPVGTVLEPRRYLYVWANLEAPQPGLREVDCIPGAPPPCLHSAWGISAGGERVYLLNDALEVVCNFEYPGSVFGGEAFGRVDDGTTTLCPTMPTAGETNTASTLR